VEVHDRRLSGDEEVARGSVFRGKVDLLIEARAWHFEQAQLPDEVKLSTGRTVARPISWR
jgi:hypothetical protein